MNNHDGDYSEDYDKRQDYDNCNMNSYGENYGKNQCHDTCHVESYGERYVRECGGLGYGEDYSKNYGQNVGTEIRNEGYDLYSWNNANYAYPRRRTDNQGILIIIIILLWFCCGPGIWF